VGYRTTAVAKSSRVSFVPSDGFGELCTGDRDEDECR
jgi:hypothetical protein